MTLNEYQKAALETAYYPKDVAILYLALAINGEAGEIAEKVKKLYRDRNGIGNMNFSKSVAMELGDVLWFVSVMAEELGFSLNDVAQLNIDKISSRKERGVIGGNGDNR